MLRYTKALGEAEATVRARPLCAVTGGSGCTARAHDTTLQSRAKRAARAASSRAGRQAGHCAGRGGRGPRPQRRREEAQGRGARAPAGAEAVVRGWAGAKPAA